MKSKTELALLLKNHLALLELFVYQDDMEIEDQLNVSPYFIRMLHKETQDTLEELQRTP